MFEDLPVPIALTVSFATLVSCVAAWWVWAATAQTQPVGTMDMALFQPDAQPRRKMQRRQTRSRAQHESQEPQPLNVLEQRSSSDDNGSGERTRRAIPQRGFSNEASPSAGGRDAPLATLAVGLGHDIGNIVLPILCHLDSLESQDLPESAKQELRALRESATRLKHLSSGLSLFAHDPDDPDATVPITHLHAWWREVEPIVRKTLPSRVALHADLAEHVPPVKMPPHQLTRVVINLVANAGEAIAETVNGAVRISFHHSQDEHDVELCISDNGRGMSGETLRFAMDPFYTTKKRGLSTGLGLSQVNSLVSSAGGTVKIESSPKLGTTIAVMLPAMTEDGNGSATGRPRARVRLSDARIASYAMALLENAGFVVPTGDHEADADDALLITEPTGETLEEARAFVRGRSGRRVIVLGQPAQKIEDRGITFIEPSHRMLQREVQKVARDMPAAVV